MDGPVTNLKVYIFAAFALAGTAGAAGAHRPRKREGSENVDFQICHWPIRDLCVQ